MQAPLFALTLLLLASKRVRRLLTPSAGVSRGGGLIRV